MMRHTAGAAPPKRGPGQEKQLGMRVALIDPSLFTVPYDRALAGGLAEAGHDVTLYGRRPGPDDPDPAGMTVVPSFYRFTSSRPIALLPRQLQLGIKGVDHIASMIGLALRLRARRPDIVHFQWLPLPSLDHRLLSGFTGLAPLVLTIHDTEPSNGDPLGGLRQRGFYESLAIFDMLIVHTEQGRSRLLAKGIAEQRITVLPHGLLEDIAMPPATADLMQGELTFLLFGKIKPYKGLDILIEAFAQVPAELRAQARIRVVGKPYMPIEPFRKLAEQRGISDRVIIEPRFVDDQEIPDLFGPGVVAVFPYREIEASGVLSLALAHGRPVVASNVGSFAEMVEDGREGLLTPSGDVPALAAALTRMIVDRRFAAGCSREARALALAVPGWDVIGQRTAELYDQARCRFAAGQRRAGAP